MFETVARSRIAALRKQHATQVMNSLLFGGSTESTAKGFAQMASSFKGERVVVGSIDASRRAKFENAEIAKLCRLSGPADGEACSWNSDLHAGRLGKSNRAERAFSRKKGLAFTSMRRSAQRPMFMATSSCILVGRVQSRFL